MKERIPLQIIDGRLVLATVIENRSLRISHKLMDFVIDTGSPDSYISDKDVRTLQIPTKNRPTVEDVGFGGTSFKQIEIPKMTMHILKEDKANKEYHTLKVSLSALKTTKTNDKNKQIAQTLPSILGLDFLIEQKISLHVILEEKIAYLELEK